MTTETQQAAQALVDAFMPSNEEARKRLVIELAAALEAAENVGAKKEREECAKVAFEMDKWGMAEAIQKRGQP
jgi:hypothetical protein